MATRITQNRMVEDLGNGKKRVTLFNEPAHETENARFDSPFTFKQHNVTASQSAVALSTGLSTGELTFYVAPRAGELVGCSWGLSAASTHTLGTVQFTVNGTAVGSVFNIDTGATAAVVDQATAISFNEGDKIGCKVTTDASWLPVTDDLAVTALVRWVA